MTNESGDFATNSGTISGSQFNDGGFGDIGQQWWEVAVGGDVITVHVSDGGTSTINGVGAGAEAVGAPNAAAEPHPSPVVDGAEASAVPAEDAAPEPEETSPAPTVPEQPEPTEPPAPDPAPPADASGPDAETDG